MSFILVMVHLSVLLYFALIAALLIYRGEWVMSHREWCMFVSAMLCWPLVVVWFIIEESARIVIKHVLSRKGWRHERRPGKIH